MSLFASRRKTGRRISSFEDEDEQGGGASLADEGTAEPPVQAPLRFGKRPFKQSSLRRSINVADSGAGDTASDPKDSTRKNDNDDDDDDEGPVVVRPPVSRSGSIRSKKRMSSSSRLSFGGRGDGGGGGGGGDDDDEGDSILAPTAVVTPKKSGNSLSQRVLETNAFRKSLSSRLPTRPADHDDHSDNDDGRPRYSKEYLEELQSSTPNTPQNLSSLRIHDDGNSRNGDAGDDAMELDPSELEGAMVVDSADLGSLAPRGASPAAAAHILTQTEIQERKDRRARLALEQDAIAVGNHDDGDDEENGFISLDVDPVASSKKKKKAESRLVHEDEDLGEGYDEFVEDGGLSLGRKAEREARRKRKQEMEALIKEAQGNKNTKKDDGNSDSDEDASDAERRAAYDAAQTRAGMDGLKRKENGDGGGDDDDDDSLANPAFVPKMKPLPELSTCLARMQGTLQTLQTEVSQRQAKLAEAEKERQEILAREAEVQEILDKAGQKYQAVLASTKPEVAAKIVGSAATQSPLRPLPPGLANGMPVERGLESLGTTPTRRTDMDM